MCGIKKRFPIILLHLFFSLIYAQNKETIYLNFDINSKETCRTLKDGGGYLNVKKFQKIKQKNGDLDFYICEELFLFKRNLEPDVCSIKQVKNIKISKIEDLKKIVDKENPLYPYRVFPHLYLVEKINDSTILKYKVKWEYYIE